MATLNLLPFIATQNAFSRREERVPVWIHSAIAGYQIDESLGNFLDKIEDYLNGIRLFGQENGRKEDGYGERTYHLKDLEEIVNIFRSIGIAKSFPDLMQDFKAGDGWNFVETTLDVTEVNNVERYKRIVSLNGDTLEKIAEDIKNGLCAGLDCVDWNGKIHRNCQLIKIYDLHPVTTKEIKELNTEGTKYVPKTIEIPGVDSELYLIITPECLEKGFNTIEGESEPSLKASPFLRSPLGFIAMRRSRAGEIPTRYPNGTALLKSMCPVTVEYHVFDSVIAKATLAVQDTRIPGIIYKSIVQHNQQAFLTPEHLQAQENVLNYVLSPQEEEDGVANIYKNWVMLTGQHHNYNHILAEALTVFNAVPRVIDDSGAKGGVDLGFALIKVLDIKFNLRWAIIEQFEAVLNPRGSQSGLSSITASNPVPYYIHTLNPETKEWEKDPITKWIMADTREKRYFAINENPFTLLDVNVLPKLEVKPLTDIYQRIQASHAEMLASLNKDKPTA